MRLLKEYRDPQYPTDAATARAREAVRIVLFDEQQRAAVLFVAKKNFYKIPGGGIEAGEDHLSALRREVLEEVGCTIEVTGELGKIVEYRSAENFQYESDLKQISYGYLGQVISLGNGPQFTAAELADGFQLFWLPLDTAIEKFKKGRPQDWDGRYKAQRDLLFLQQINKYD